MNLKSLKIHTNNTHFKAFGNSMIPLFFNEDIVNLKKTYFGQLKINDLISFKQKNRIITHRIIYKKQNYLITKGDHNFKNDGKIYKENIIGKVISVKRDNKIISPETIYLLQSTIYLNEIKFLTRELISKQIDFVFLKGLPVHLHYEKTHPRRLYVDCDILIDKNYYKKTINIFKKFGYKLLESNQKSSIIRGRHSTEESYFKSVNGFKVVFDIHSEPAFLMTQLGQLDSIYPQKLLCEFGKKLLDEKQSSEINGVKIPILSNENLFIYLALHLFHHNFKGYYRYELLDNLIRNKKFNYERIAIDIFEFQFSSFVYPVFLLLKKYYNSPLPKSFLTTIKDSSTYKSKFKKITSTNIFDDEARLTAGVKRFKLIYDLSPQPFYKKNFVFTNREVIYSVFSVLRIKIFSFTRSSINSLKSLST